MTRRILTTVLLLVTLGTVGVTSAETPDELTRQCAKGNATGCFNLVTMYDNGTTKRSAAASPR